MAGHNKWSKIKNKKAVSDVKKSQMFSKMVRLISIEAKKADGDLNSPGLRVAIQKAKEINMPAQNIERAISKATNAETNSLEEIRYETYGPGGCAIVIETLTNNRNKTSAEIKHILSKNGYQLAEIGSAIWAFNKTDGGWEAKSKIDLTEQNLIALENLLKELEDNDSAQEVFINAN